VANFNKKKKKKKKSSHGEKGTNNEKKALASTTFLPETIGLASAPNLLANRSLATGNYIYIHI
jgi:hypothetical protein